MKLGLFLTIAIIFLTSCSIWESQKVEKNDGIKAIRSQWFSKSKRFGLKNARGKVATHWFFDPKINWDKENKTLRVVPLIPEDTSIYYSLDLATGQIYSAGPLCSMNDLSLKVSHAVKKPPMTYGIVPRMVTALGQPQEIFVFGRKDLFQRYHLGFVHDVRLVGALRLRFCLKGKCSTEDWIPKTILLGVQQSDPKLGQVTTVAELKTKIDPNEVEAWANNALLRNNYVGQEYLGQEVYKWDELDKLLEFWPKNNYIFTRKRMKLLREKCVGLYDQMFHKFKKDNEYYYTEWKRFYKEKRDDLNLCRQYVLPSEYTYDSDRHWIFTYFSAFSALDDLGLNYNCKKMGWERRNKNEEFDYDPKNCPDQKFDYAFSTAISALKSMMNTDDDTYRFIEYDDSLGGTHQRFYWWVKQTANWPRCEENKMWFRSFFPDDVKWQTKKGKKVDRDRSRVIY